MLKFVLLSRNTRTWVIYLNVDSLKAGTMSVLFTVASPALNTVFGPTYTFQEIFVEEDVNETVPVSETVTSGLETPTGSSQREQVSGRRERGTVAT